MLYFQHRSQHILSPTCWVNTHELRNLEILPIDIQSLKIQDFLIVVGQIGQALERLNRSAPTGTIRSNFLTQARVFSARCSKDGANQTFRRVRFKNLAWRYGAWRFIRERRHELRDSRVVLSDWPRWVSSAPRTTFSPCTNAIPVVWEAGSIFKVIYSGVAVTTTFKMIVNGFLRKTAAFGAFNNLRALPGWTGKSGRFSVSRTKTRLDILSPPLRGNVSFDLVIWVLSAYNNVERDFRTV